MLVLFAIAAVAWTLVGGAARADAFPFPGNNGKIVFVSDRDSVDANGDSIIQSSERNRDVYSVNADGSGLQRLTNSPATETRPAVAPDGRRIAFTSNRGGAGEDIYIMNADGTNETRVTDRGAPDRGPTFSADGQRLAYTVRHTSTLPGGESEGDIWTVNVDGTETTRLTFNRQLDEFDPAFSPDGSRIAFVSAAPDGPSTSRDIFVMDADGSNVTNLTATNGGAGFEDEDPAFSPDGKSIVFTSRRSGGTEIWVMDADGTDARQLTNVPDVEKQPAFSPDGLKVAFTARRGARTNVYTMNAADGSGQTRLTDETLLDEQDEQPTWQPVPPANQLEAYIDSGPKIVGSNPVVTFTYSGAPGSQLSGFLCRLDGGDLSQCPASGVSYSGLADGEHTFSVKAVGAGDPDPEPAKYRFEIDTTRIVFASGEADDSEIYVVNPDGSGRLRLTNNAARDDEPALSPDGSRVAFVSNRDGDNEIYVMDADGTGGATQLTNNSASEGSPAYSPDGSKIAFVTRRDGNFEVYVMAANGAAPTNLTNDPALDSEPSFSGDGTKIAFQSNRAAGNTDIYSMNADGTATNRLTTYVDTDRAPDFSPDGAQIAFTRNVIDPGGTLPSNDDIWVMDADGNGERNITNHPRGIHDREPSYRPDGTKIVYQDQGDIYIRDPDGTAATKVTDRLHLDSAPDWGPAYTDLDPPNTIIDSDPGSVTNDPTATFTFSSTEGGSSFECKLDSGSFETCTSPKSYSGLSQGPHTVEVRATDPAGNTDASPATRNFTVDTIAPSLVINSGPSGPTTNPSPSFGFTAEGGSTVSCSIDTGTASFGACSGAGTHSPAAPLGDDSYSFRVRAIDTAGNQTTASRDFAVDTAAPNTTIVSGPTGPTGPSPSFGFSSTESGSTFECKLDLESFQPCTSPKAYSGLTDGPHSFEVRAIDPVGNTDASPASRAFSVDPAIVEPDCAAAEEKVKQAKQKVKKAKKKVKKAKKKVKKAKSKTAKKKAKKQLKKAKKQLKKAKKQLKKANNQLQTCLEAGTAS